MDSFREKKGTPVSQITNLYRLLVGANMCLSRAVPALHINLYKLIISYSQRATLANIYGKGLL